MIEIERRIEKAQAIEDKIEQSEAEIDPEGEHRGTTERLGELHRERAVTDILIELMECLKAGEDLREAIETIHANF